MCAFIPSASLPSFTSHVFRAGLGLRWDHVRCLNFGNISILCESTTACAYRVLTYDWSQWTMLIMSSPWVFGSVYVVGLIARDQRKKLPNNNKSNEAIIRTFVIMENAWNLEWVTCSSRGFICVTALCPWQRLAQPARTLRFFMTILDSWNIWKCVSAGRSNSNCKQ